MESKSQRVKAMGSIQPFEQSRGLLTTPINIARRHELEEHDGTSEFIWLPSLFLAVLYPTSRYDLVRSSRAVPALLDMYFHVDGWLIHTVSVRTC